MGSKWVKHRLGDIATFSYGKMPKKELLGTGKYVVFSGYKYLENYPEKNTSAGDLLVVARGVGGTGDVKIAVTDCYLTNLSIKIDLDNIIIKNEYFYYLFLHNNLRYLDSGSAQSQITINDLANVELSIPSLENQIKTIEHLNLIDKKISVNGSINQTLEQMSQTLFKSWFVDFDPVIDNALDAGNAIPESLENRSELRQKVRNSAGFKPLPTDIRALFPSEFEKTELGWVPKGWEIGKLQDLLILQRGFDLPSSQRNNGLHPIISASGYNGTHNIGLVKFPGIVTGRSGVLGNVFLILEDFWPLNTTLWVKEFKHATPCYGYELLKMIDFSSFNGGSAVPTLNRNHIHNLDYFLPSKKLIEKFESFSMLLHKRVRKLQKQSQTLTNLRDTLLPRLISGELSLEDLPDLIKQTEAA